MVSVLYASDAQEYASAIERLLEKYDEEFCPPLSSRDSTTQTGGLNDERQDKGIQAYLENVLGQEVLIGKDGDDVIAFLSFTRKEEKDLLEEQSPCVYVTTTIVEDAYRESGVATKLNRKLLDEIVPEMDVDYVTRRTWSTNKASMAYIESLGFDIVRRVEDDRGDGIDSLYYAKRV